MSRQRVCSYRTADHSCPELTDHPSGRCPAHARKPWAGSNRAHDLPKGWAKLRAAIIHRDHHRCTLCGSTTRLEVDHTNGRHDHRPVSLRTLCHDCHTTVTARQSAAAHDRTPVVDPRHPPPPG